MNPTLIYLTKYAKDLPLPKPDLAFASFGTKEEAPYPFQTRSLTTASLLQELQGLEGVLMFVEIPEGFKGPLLVEPFLRASEQFRPELIYTNVSCSLPTEYLVHEEPAFFGVESENCRAVLDQSKEPCLGLSLLAAPKYCTILENKLAYRPARAWDELTARHGAHHTEQLVSLLPKPVRLQILRSRPQQHFWERIRELFCLHRKFLVLNFVLRNLKNKYQRGALGFFWTLLSPMATAFIYYGVFKFVLKVQIPHYMPFVLIGTLAWSFFSQSIQEGVSSLVGNRGLLTKVPIPIQVFPFVGTTTNWVTLVMATPVILIALFLSSLTLSFKMVLFFPLLFCLHLIAYALASMGSIFFVYFRDLNHLVGILLNLWFYATPIIYPINHIPESLRWVIQINPIGYLFEALHQVMIYDTWPEATHLCSILAWTLGLLFLADWVRTHHARFIVERI
jgi:ABC-type polysaccharide/polyol phosphate export permease